MMDNGMIIGLIPLYKPTKEELINIKTYIDKLDFIILLDDSGYSNEELCRDILKDYSNHFQYKDNKINIGLCKSVNNGFETALGMGAEWVLVMNPDSSFGNNIVGIYRDYIRKHDTKEIGILAPRYNIDRHRRESGSGYKSIKYADMSGSLYNLSIMKKIGLYDPKTYFYGLDAEYCLRVLKYGYRIIECSEAVLNHKPGETYEVKLFGRTIFRCGKDSPQRYYYQFRSYYYINNIYHSMYHSLWITYKLFKAIFFFDHKKEYLKMIRQAKNDYKNNYFGIIR